MTDGFATDPDRVSHVVVLICFCFFATVAVIFRLWARRVQRARWESSDYLCIAALVLCLGLASFTIHSQIYWDLGVETTTEGDPRAITPLVILQIKAIIVGEVLWVVAVFFVRASVLELYIRLFRTTKSFRITCYVIHIINVAFTTAVVLAACLICRPIAYNWDRTIPGGTCGDQKSLDIFIGVFNLLMDIVIVLLPIPVLWGLQMATSRKIVLSGMFGMGTIICIITLVRIWVTTLNNGPNAQKVYSMIALLTNLEALLGVINACLPVMRPVFTKFGNSRIIAFFSNTILSPTAKTGHSTNGASKSSPGKPSGHKHYKVRNSAIGGTFEEKKEMQAWPSTNSTSNGSSETSMHHFVDKKAAQLMFSQTPDDVTTSVPGNHTLNFCSPLRRPPKSKFYSSETPVGETGELGIVVRRDWDVERGERPASDETERELLEHERDVKNESS